MNKKKIIIFFFFLIYNSLLGQEIDLQKDNAEYLLKFESIKNFSSKKNLIKEKLLRDKVFIPDSCISINKIQGNQIKYTYFCNKWKSQSGKKCGKKILHFIFYKKGKEMIQLDETINPNSNKILDLLNDKNIDNIMNFDSKMSAIFGSNADETNTIIIYTNDKSIKKIIREYRKNKNDS
ncbi:MAG: hypothetical protein MUF43_05980 [Flavobacterium sp.]|jgi:hypothetical protein|nr:hypothetical protein [Flavobacterium sp.]